MTTCPHSSRRIGRWGRADGRIEEGDDRHGEERAGDPAEARAGEHGHRDAERVHSTVRAMMNGWSRCASTWMSTRIVTATTKAAAGPCSMRLTTTHSVPVTVMPRIGM